MKSVKNIAQGWITTIIGIVLIVASILSVFKLPGVVLWWPQATIAILIGILLILAPDTLISTAVSILKRLTSK